MKPFNILIVEDELMIAEMTKEILIELNYSVIGTAKNHDEAYRLLEGQNEIDLAILDINLSREKDGIDLAREIEEKYKFPFIYLTSYSDPKTIKKASSTKPSAYLLKPYTKEDLFTTIELIRARKEEINSSIILKDGSLSVKVNVNDILYIKSDNNYLEIKTTDKKFLVRNSLEKFLEELNDDNFIRTHRSYAVNILKVNAVNGQYVLIGDEKIPLSRSQKEELMDYFHKQ